MPTFLMCPPDYYQIEYEINPWMDRRHPAETTKAREQWQSLYDLLTGKLGATVELMTPVKGLPDLVFTANAGLVSGRKFIRSNFRFPQRQGEAPHFEAWFKKQNYQIFSLPEKAFFEGEGDALSFGNLYFAGYRMRSDIGSHREVAEIIGHEVLSLELIDPRFYHLDTCFCPLNDRVAFYFPPAFDDYGRKVIASTVPEAIPVVPEEALRFACNAIVIGSDVVLHAGCESINGELRRRGFKVHELDLSEFHRAGGSAKCMVLRL